MSELREDLVAEDRLDEESKHETQKALDKCVDLLQRTVNSMNIPMPSYVKVSSAISHSLFDQC